MGTISSADKAITDGGHQSKAVLSALKVKLQWFLFERECIYAVRRCDHDGVLFNSEQTFPAKSRRIPSEKYCGL